MRRHIVGTVMLLTIAASHAVMQEKGGVDLTGPYEVVPNWLKPVSPGRLLYPIAVFAENPDRIFIGSVGTAPMPANGIKPYGNFRPNAPGAKVDHQVIVVDRNGALIENWSQWSELFGSPHRVTINPYDPDKHVWVIDRASQQLLKFTNDGKRLVMAVGERGVAGDDDKHFGRPTGIAWLPDGTFFVSDGYDNARVVKFDKTGKFLKSWGRKGTAPGEFNGVHAIAVDAERRVYVVDRNNARIQIFDEHGKFLDQWPNFSSPTQIVVSQDQFVWVSDGGVGGRGGGANRLLKYDKNGKLLTYWGTQGTFPGAMAGPHDFHVDSDGNLYVSNGLDQRVDKYVPRKNAEPGRLIKQPFK
jgi:DNA-binding beta-propeller fold protein YncE